MNGLNEEQKKDDEKKNAKQTKRIHSSASDQHFILGHKSVSISGYRCAYKLTYFTVPLCQTHTTESKNDNVEIDWQRKWANGKKKRVKNEFSTANEPLFTIDNLNRLSSQTHRIMDGATEVYVVMCMGHEQQKKKFP